MSNKTYFYQQQRTLPVIQKVEATYWTTPTGQLVLQFSVDLWVTGSIHIVLLLPVCVRYFILLSHFSHQ